MRTGCSLVFLVLAAGACFSDNAPVGLSTSGTGTGDASTTGTSTGAAATTGPATTGATQTGSTGSGGTTDPGTTTTAPGTGTTTTGVEPSTGGSSTAGGTDFSECGQTETAYTCEACCRKLVPGSNSYMADVAACACVENSPCLAPCSTSLCDGKDMSEVCFNCLLPLIDNACSAAAAEACLTDEACSPYFECLGTQDCAGKAD